MTRFAFTISATDGAARTGSIAMQRGEIRTPAFMPVGTAATVKAMKPEAVRQTGADIILGHHAHILKGIEVYRGKVIFYSLCNFALEAPQVFMEGTESKESSRHMEIRDLNKDIKPDDPRRMPTDTRKTIIVKCPISDKQIKKVSFQPVYLNDDSEPEILDPGDDRFNEVVDYIKMITLDQGIVTRFTIDGNEVIVETTGK